MLRTKIIIKAEAVTKPDWQEGQIFEVEHRDKKKHVDVLYGMATGKDVSIHIITLPKRRLHLTPNQPIPKRAKLLTDEAKLFVIRGLLLAAEKFHQLKVL